MAEFFGDGNFGPRRIELSRKKGWRMPPNTVKVDRSTKWGNWAAGAKGILEKRAAFAEFERWLRDEATDGYKARVRAELRGKNLACWCHLDQPCHADLLLKIANGD